MISKIENLGINTIRVLAVEAINKANSGHPGIALGAAPIMHTLFSKSMKISPKNSKWINRDRFVLSAGHGSALLYATLHLLGYSLSMDDLKDFRSLDSLTPGHPEVHLTDGVDASSGPLGQGIAEGVEMAISEKHLNARFPNIIDHYTFILCGDGDLQEGVSQEAISLAGHLGLNKIILLNDSNDVQLDGNVNEAYSDNVRMKFEAMNWDYQLVKDGEDIESIYKAVETAKLSTKPSLIEVKTIIGRGASNQGKSSVHGSPIKPEEVVKLRGAIGGDEFTADPKVYEFYNQAVAEYGDKEYEKWVKVTKSLDTTLFDKMINDEIVIDENLLPKFSLGESLATRASSGKVLDKLNELNPMLIGGSADLSSSTKVSGADGVFGPNNPLGRNIKFGVREHAMAAICNGIALHGGLRPFCSGFFVFSDYMKPAIRLSAIMELPVIYLFTHDSIAVGEDGPTHQPIEQLTMLRSIPNLNVIRPADANEVKAAYKVALQSKTTPTAIILTRQNLQTIIENVNLEKGGYVVRDVKDMDGIIIASGSELALALKAAEKLSEENINVRVVNMPAINLFEKQSEEYRNEVLPSYITKRLAIEMSEASHFFRYVGIFGDVLNINEFGKSAPGSKVIEYFSFTVDQVIAKYKALPKIDITRYL